MHWILSHRQRPRPRLLREGEAPVAREVVADWIPMIRRWRMQTPRRRAADVEAAEVVEVAVAVAAAMLLLPSPSIRL